jgi:hypothetical protein
MLLRTSRVLWRCLALVALLMPPVAARAETPWPLKTPAELKALHGPTFTGLHILTYRRSQDPKEAGTAPETVIGIGGDIMFRDDGGSRRVVDLRLGRIYDLRKNKRYVNHPMAADIVWFDSELSNRIALGKALAAGGLDQDKQSMVREPFWDAVELKVTVPNEPPPVVETREQGGETAFVYNGQEAVRWRPMDQPLPSAVAANLGRALLWFFPGHPHLLARLAVDGKAPRRLMLRARLAGAMRTDDYQLIRAQWCETCVALPADAQPALAVGGVFEKELAPVMIAASQGKHKSTSSDEYLRRVDRALDRDAPLEAFLWFMERLLQDGARRCQADEAGEYCRVQKRMFAQARTNADLQTFHRSISTQSAENASAIAALRGKVSANAYYIDLAAVNATPPQAFRFKTGEQEPLKTAERRMASALAGMPMVPAVYRDIGNVYFAAVNPRLAWLAWEMGKGNPGRSAEQNLWQQPARVEAQVRQRHPEFFLTDTR